jgi:phosphatidylglycerol:prolipoprotein diacylglycerol transferase
MFPILIEIGPITVHTYGFLVAVGFLVGIYLAEHQAIKEGVDKEIVANLGIYIILAAIVGSRLAFVIIEYRHYLEDPIGIFKIWEGGLVFYGGLLAAVPVTLIYVKKKKAPVWKIADIYAPSVALGHGIGRLGCFSAGCCYGAHTDLPWAVTFTNPKSLVPQAILNVPLHPTQIYEAVGEFLIFTFLIFYRKKQTFTGQIFFLYGLLYSVLRFLVEMVRGAATKEIVFANFSVAQLTSVFIFIFSIVMYIRFSGQAKRLKADKKATG